MSRFSNSQAKFTLRMIWRGLFQPIDACLVFIRMLEIPTKIKVTFLKLSKIFHRGVWKHRLCCRCIFIDNITTSPGEAETFSPNSVSPDKERESRKKSMGELDGRHDLNIRCRHGIRIQWFQTSDLFIRQDAQIPPHGMGFCIAKFSSFFLWSADERPRLRAV